MAGPPEMIATSAVSAFAIEPVDLHRFPWIRPLVSEYARNFVRVSPLFSGNPDNPDAWRDRIKEVTHQTRDRVAVHRAVRAQLESRGAPHQAIDSAAKLANPASVAIVTGQQAGVFGGPLYTLLKAVTAIQLARRVEQQHGTTAVPVFWVDAEDHDWDEVRTARVLDADMNVQPITVADPPGARSLPVSALVVDPAISTALEAIAALLPKTDFTTEVVNGLSKRYRPGVTVGTAFAGWLDDLLGPHGLVVFESDEASLKPAVGDLFARELDHPGRTAKLAREAGAVMASLGHQPQVEPAEDSVALFYLDGRSRRPIRRQGSSYLIGDTARSAAELGAEVASHPERFSPNVLLRPLVQDRLFPTVCYVAGPSELAYHAQLGGLYRDFGIEAPLLCSRASATIVDSAAARFLERSKLPLEALHARDESALNRLLESLLPPEIERTIKETDRLVEERVTRLKEPVAAIDPTLAGAVDTTLDRMRETLKHLNGKIIQAAKRKDETLRRQFHRTRALAFPNGEPQERILNAVVFLNRYGPTLVDRLLAHLPLDTGRHYIVTL